MNFLSIENINYGYGNTNALHNINFYQNKFEKIVIAGETGSGKTTLLQIIAGLLQPATGKVLLEDERVLGPLEKLLPGNKNIAYLSQHFELRFNYYVHEQLEMANKLSNAQAEKIYSVCQIQHLLKRRVEELSGGERQRIALARLLSSSPKLLLLDEPFSNLDATHKSIIKKVIENIGKELEITCIIVSHDAADSLSWAERIIIMKDGIIIQDANPKEIYYHPINEYCASLFGDYNLIDTNNLKQLFPSQNILQTTKKILLRPEQFEITTQNNHSAKGIIQSIIFYGSYYMLNILISNTIISIKTLQQHYKINDTIFITLNANKLVYI
ncbi:MAG: ABC transporter ATP-binding protein [Bacteroidetes bacterium]|nr:ABC transporter ATP-binding protein [Bacteroidota bacterium]MBS1650179.1 ABC transporter ATP-binding protein [Bacteroidota bacterium]